MIDIKQADRDVFDRLKSHGRITQSLRRLITQQWNVCVSCNEQVAEGRPVFAGYDAGSNPLFVGACCADQLQDLATPVYWSGSLNLSAPDGQSVWRYMDFAKFVAMLQNGGLYFPRADKLDDPFEGAGGLAHRENEWDEHYLEFFRESVMSPPPGYPIPKHSKEHVEAEAQRLLQSIKMVSSEARTLMVSCWHENEVESEALWRLYCPPLAPGIAVRTTVGQLWDACAQAEHALVGRVHYVDFKRSFASIQNERIFQKRLSLSHEREVRVVLQNDRQSPVEGKMLSCDLSGLLSDVVISPFAPSWFQDVVSGAIEKFGYSFELRQSELLDQPFY